MISGHGTASDRGRGDASCGAFDFIEKPFASERVLVTHRATRSTQPRCADENRVAEAASRVAVSDRRRQRRAARRCMDGDPAGGADQRDRAASRARAASARSWWRATIHRNSLRSRERFVQVNCAAIPEELIESELFGHEKGSFTGATEKQIGKFEQADHGTIFLDEVGDMSLKTQAKVLRVLQEGEVERLGSATHDQGGRARDRRDQQEPRRGDRARATSARICTSASPSSRFTCRRCASAATTSRCWSGTSSTCSAARTTSGRSAFTPRGDGGAASATAGAATSASCATPSSG